MKNKGKKSNTESDTDTKDRHYCPNCGNPVFGNEDKLCNECVGEKEKLNTELSNGKYKIY